MRREQRRKINWHPDEVCHLVNQERVLFWISQTGFAHRDIWLWKFTALPPSYWHPSSSSSSSSSCSSSSASSSSSSSFSFSSSFSSSSSSVNRVSVLQRLGIRLRRPRQGTSPRVSDLACTYCPLELENPGVGRPSGPVTMELFLSLDR